MSSLSHFSASMLPLPNEPEKGDRARAMIEAGKRWVKYEIPDSVKLGMAIFSYETNSRPYQNMTEINDANRDLLITKEGFIYLATDISNRIFLASKEGFQTFGLELRQIK